MTYEWPRQPKTREEALQFLERHEQGIPLYLKERISKLTDLSTIPVNSSKSSQPPKDCLSFSTAQGNVSVYFSEIDHNTYLVCIYDNLGNYDFGEDTPFDGIGIVPDNDWISALALNRFPMNPSLTIERTYLETFRLVSREIAYIIQNGNVSQGDREFVEGIE